MSRTSSAKPTPTGKGGKPEPVRPTPASAKSVASPAPAKAVTSQNIGGFDPSKYTRPGLSADDIIRIKECFDIFDYDKSGAITYIHSPKPLVPMS